MNFYCYVINLGTEAAGNGNSNGEYCRAVNGGAMDSLRLGVLHLEGTARLVCLKHQRYLLLVGADSNRK